MVSANIIRFRIDLKGNWSISRFWVEDLVRVFKASLLQVDSVCSELEVQKRLCPRNTPSLAAIVISIHFIVPLFQQDVSNTSLLPPKPLAQKSKP